jgi:RNA polymerase sigma factor (sigma-70 family)
MPDASDIALAREYARHSSEAAFAELVRRYINLVYSVALRFTRNPPDAQDVTQAVFAILARKAGSLRERTLLAGWLYETTRFTAMQFLRNRIRRQRCEEEAHMQSVLEHSNADTVWQQMEPLLEGAMSRLNEKDRALLALRFFENHTVAETAAMLGAGEWAVRKRGVTSTTATIAQSISANSIQVAPMALAKGATASASTLTLIKGAMKIMAWTKMQTVAVVGVAVILATGATGLVIKHAHQQLAREPLPEKSWAFKGFATPEATFQSAFWAMSKGDLKTVTDSYTAEFGNQFMETAGKGKSDAELSALFVQIAAAVSDFRVVSKETLSQDELVLHIRSTHMGNTSVPMKKIGNEWKINGNLATDQQNNYQSVR